MTNIQMDDFIKLLLIELDEEATNSEAEPSDNHEIAETLRRLERAVMRVQDKTAMLKVAVQVSDDAASKRPDYKTVTLIQGLIRHEIKTMRENGELLL